MNDDHHEEPLPSEMNPAADSDMVEILDLPSWIGVAIGVLLVLIAAVAVWQVN